jgi:hypothetical protein
MGQRRFRTSATNASRAGMHSKGSKPSVEIGGSFVGEAQSRMRPRRRGSKKATRMSVLVSVGAVGVEKWITNCG